MSSEAPSTVHQHRVRIFIDFWNFQLSLNRRMGREFRLDWSKLGPCLATEVGTLTLGVAKASEVRFDGLHVYLSYNPSAPQDRGLLKWASNVLDRMPGVQMNTIPRKMKHPPSCPLCHQSVERCPHCDGSMVGTVEKGVDTAIVTDMIKLAWENAYDVAMLVSSDADFVPAVKFLDAKGRRIIHGGFPPRGMDLARNCWASVDLSKLLTPLGRPSSPTAQSPSLDEPGNAR